MIPVVPKRESLRLSQAPQALREALYDLHQAWSSTSNAHVQQALVDAIAAKLKAQYEPVLAADAVQTVKDIVVKHGIMTWVQSRCFPKAGELDVLVQYFTFELDLFTGECLITPGVPA
jgi:hypothetical protein